MIVSRIKHAPRRIADVAELRPEEPVTDRLEIVGCTSGQETMGRSGCCRVAFDAPGEQSAVDILGGLLRAGHQRDLVAQDVGDHSGQQRVVRAAQDQGVDALGDQGSRYSCAAAWSSGPLVMPRSTYSTNNGHTWVWRLICGAAAKASS